MSPNAGVSLTILRSLPIFEMLDDECLKPLAGVAMLPYLAWCGFASVLNYNFWLLNP